MARILGVDIPNDKPVAYSLTYIYGIGLPTAKKILAAVGINPAIRTKELSDADLAKIIKEIQNMELVIEGDLRREIAMTIKAEMEIGSYRGIRHRRNLPCRGQRTKTNARTVKGPRKTVANKKIESR